MNKFDRLEKNKVDQGGQTVKMLKKVWDEMPQDLSSGERALFIEIAERLIKLDPGEVN
jgi:hypothetical protein